MIVPGDRIVFLGDVSIGATMLRMVKNPTKEEKENGVLSAEFEFMDGGVLVYAENGDVYAVMGVPYLHYKGVDQSKRDLYNKKKQQEAAANHGNFQEK